MGHEADDANYISEVNKIILKQLFQVEWQTIIRNL